MSYRCTFHIDVPFILMYLSYSLEASDHNRCMQKTCRFLQKQCTDGRTSDGTRCGLDSSGWLCVRSCRARGDRTDCDADFARRPPGLRTFSQITFKRCSVTRSFRCANLVMLASRE